MIDEKKVKELFETAKISYTESDLKIMTEKLQIMVSVIEKVDEIDVSETAFTPMGKSTVQLREDIVGAGMSQKELMSNLPEGAACFCVPSVMSGEVQNEA